MEVEALPCGLNLGPLQVLVRVVPRAAPKEAFRFHREYTHREDRSPKGGEEKNKKGKT